MNIFKMIRGFFYKFNRSSKNMKNGNQNLNQNLIEMSKDEWKGIILNSWILFNLRC